MYAQLWFSLRCDLLHSSGSANSHSSANLHSAPYITPYITNSHSMYNSFSTPYITNSHSSAICCRPVLLLLQSL